MNRKQLAKNISIITETPAARVDRIIQVLINQIEREVKTGGTVSLNTFGKFYLSNPKPRKVGNFNRGEKVVIQPKPAIKFKAAR